MRTTITIEQIDARLPQTQCTQCGYPRCRAYAEALADGSAGIDQCPPGGDVTIEALAALLQLPPKPLNPRYGAHKPRAHAIIDETLCIGCRKCIEVCPVDAIVGARKLMHTVITQECTGCELCLPPCPVDCIAMVPILTEHARNASGSDHTNSPLPQSGRRDGGVTDVQWTSVPSSGCAGSSRTPAGINEGEGEHGNEPWPEYTRAETARWRTRTEQRLQRLAKNKRARRAQATDNTLRSDEVTAPLPHDRERIRAEIRAAIARVKAKRKVKKF